MTRIRHSGRCMIVTNVRIQPRPLPQINSQRLTGTLHIR